MDRVTTASALVNGLALLMVTAAVPADTVAQTNGDTLRMEVALTLARQANPTTRAAALHADVSAERIPQTGALPDPTLTLGLLNRNANGFGMGTAMAMNSVQLSQRFPWPGRLGFARDQASHLAQAYRFEASEVELDLIAQVKTVYLEIAYIDRALAVMEDTRQLLRDFLDVSSSLYAVGSGQQQDVLQAQVAVASTTEDMLVLEHKRVANVARLDALLGRDVETQVIALELPAVGGGLPSVDSLLQLASAFRPAYAAAIERSLAAEAGMRAAQRAMYPDLTFTVGYGQRPDYPDVASLAVGVSLPLWAGSRQLPLRREMAAQHDLEGARAAELRNETAARLGELRAEAVRARNLVNLYETSILPQAHAAMQAALSAYRVGTVDFSTLVQSQMTVNRYSIEAVRLTAEYHRAVASIEALTGGALGGGS